MGVTLGFFAEDLRQGREERARASSILSQLQADLASDSVELARVLAGVDGFTERGHGFLLILSEASPRPDSIVRAARSLLFYPIYRPTSVAYVNIKEGGQLTLISDPALRTAITAYYEKDRPLVERLWGITIQSRDRLSSALAPHLAFQVDDSTAAFPPIPPQALISSSILIIAKKLLAAW